MFKVECFTEDKDVGAILKALAETGKALDVRPLYMVNAKATKPSLPRKVEPTVKAETDGDTTTLLVNHLKKVGLTEFRFRDVAKFCTALGYTKGAASSVLTRLIEQGGVTKVSHGTYRLLTGAE